MTTAYHTDIARWAPADAATFNLPFGQLDAALGTHIGTSDIHVAHSGVSMTAGAGFVAGSGGTITQSRTFTIGVATTIQAAAGAGLSVEANAVRLTAGYNPGAAASILASDATGKLTLPLMVASTSLQTPLLTTASGDLTIDPAGVVKFPIAQTLKTADFDSDFPILGWQINENPAIAGQSALTIGAIAADELHVKIFVADETRVDRGDEYWTKSYGIVAETFTTPSAIGGTVTVVFEDSPALEGEIFSVNDWLLFRQVDIDTGFDLATIWGQVSGYTDLADGLQSWTFTLRSGDTLKEIKTGSLATDFGATNAGLIHLSTIDAAGAPYIKMRRWSGANPYEPANYTTYVQIGNLDSVSNASLPAPSGYGLYVRSGTAGRGIIIDDNGVLIQGADLKLYNGATQTVNLSYTGTDFWIGLSSSDKRFVWDGTALSITGSIYATDGYIGGTTAGWAIETGKLSSTNIELLSGASARLQVGSGSDIAGVAATAAGSDIAFWAGDTHANRTTADFRVTAAGALYATTGTIAGDFTVASPGRIIAGGGHVIASVSGLDISSYDFASQPNPTENVRAIAWWPDASTKQPTDTPDARIWGGRTTAGDRAIQLDVDPNDSTSPRMWLQKQQNILGFSGVKWVQGLPGIFLLRDAVKDNITVSGALTIDNTSTFVANTHLKTTYVNAAPAYDIGEAGTKWRTIYVGHIEADTISGTSLSGATWRHDTASMGIYSSSAGTRTLTIANDGDGVMNVEIDGSLKVVTGNITLEGAGATVDGVDLSAFYTAYGSHSHALPAHAYDDAVHTGTLSWSKVSKTGSNLNEIATRSHTVLSDIGSYTHAQIDSHINTADTHVAHSTVSVLGGNGLTGGGTINATQTLHVAVSGLGLSVGADAVTLTSSSAGEANAHILATDVNGYTQVQRLGIGGAPTAYNLAVTGTGRFSSTLYAGDDLDVYDTLTVGGAGSVTGNFKVGAGAGVLRVLAAGQRVGINCDADSQFSLDIAGAARAEYWVGPHAIQLSGAVAIMHFDGPVPHNKDFSGTPDTHMGVRGTTTGAVVYRPGMFGKAVQVAETTTNLVTNPSFELDAAGWSAQGTTTVTRILFDTAPYGSYVAVVDPQGAIGNGAQYICTAATSGATQYTASLYVYPLTSETFRLWLYDDVSGGAYTDYSGLPVGQWTRITKTFTFGAGSAVRCIFIQNATSFTDFFIDAVQLEAKGYATPYHDGSLTSPACWDVPTSPHASISTRTAATLKYNWSTFPVDNLTIMAWVRPEFSGYIRMIAADNSSTYYYQFFLDEYNRVIVQWGNSGSTASVSDATCAAGEWTHVAATISNGTATVYVNGVASGNVSTGHGLNGHSDNLGIGCDTGLPQQFGGLIDDFVILNRAATAGEILSAYASRAPVFAESSVSSFRAPTKSNLRVDEYGMWFTGAAGGEIFGMYGGDPARILTTQSWGGVTMEEGDVVIGRTTDSGAALHWDDSESTLRLGVRTGNHLELTSTTFKIKAGAVEKISLDGSGNASITGVLAMGASGRIDMATVDLDNDGIRVTAGLEHGDSNSYRFVSGSNTVTGFYASKDSGSIFSTILTNVITGGNTAITADVNVYTTISGAAKGVGVVSQTSMIATYLNSANVIVSQASLVLRASSGGTDLLFNGYSVLTESSYISADDLGGYSASDFGRLAATNTWSAAQTFSNGVTLGTAGVLSARADTDTLHYIGRAAIGYTGFADIAVFAHRDVADTTNYGFMQGSTGVTYINASAAGAIHLKNANNDIAVISSSGMSISGGTLGVTGLITATGGINSLASMKATATYFDITQMSSAPDNPASGTARLYVTNVGDGRRQLTIKFADGTVHNFVSSTTSA